jgi:DNA polymerase-3 subunit gamma/tau
VVVLIERLDLLRSAVAGGSAMVAAPAEAIFASAAIRPAPAAAQPDAELPPASQPPAAQEGDSRTEGDPQVFWQRLLERAASQKPALAASLNKCSLKALEEGRAVIEVCGNEFILNSVRKHLRLIEELCGLIRGRATRVVLEANIEDAAFKEEQKKKNGLLKQKALSHPLVLEALELFDGRVIDVKLKQ